MRIAHRFSGEGKPYEGLTRKARIGPVWTGEVRVVEQDIELPLHWLKPSLIFVNSMSDVLHPTVATGYPKGGGA